MKITSLFALAVFALLITACNKTEGPGGTSTIRGTVWGRSYNAAQKEITEIIVSPGSQLEHGDFWVINAPLGGTFYYIWYDNPTWVSNGDPQLEGRTGIGVSFNYSDSNLEIAQNTADALSAYAGGDFMVVLENDVITLTNRVAGNVPDANNMSTPFEINIGNQGEDQVIANAAPLADAKVYIVYGDAAGYGDQVRTGGDGDYTFSNLVKGDYTIYVVSEDTLNPGTTIKTTTTVSIAKNKTVQQAADLELIY
jgi:hypothetical protein